MFDFSLEEIMVFSNKSKQIGIDSILKNNSAEIFFPRSKKLLHRKCKWSQVHLMLKSFCIHRHWRSFASTMAVRRWVLSWKEPHAHPHARTQMHAPPHAHTQTHIHTHAHTQTHAPTHTWRQRVRQKDNERESVGRSERLREINAGLLEPS